MDELTKMIFAQADAMNHQFQLGLKSGKEINRIAHRALKAAYENAVKDPKASIPSSLECAIENILRLREEQETNDYANAAIKSDKEVPQWEREARTGAKDVTVGS